MIASCSHACGFSYDQEPDLESESLNTLIFQALHSAKQAVIPTGPNESVRCNAFWKKLVTFDI